MRYSNHAQSAIDLAHQEAARLGHDHISTGHLILGLIREGEGSALSFLKDAKADLEKMKKELEDSMEIKGHSTFVGALKFTSRARRALELADEESRKMGHKYIGTKHILIGIILEQDGVAPRILEKAGIDLDKVRSFALQTQIDEEENFETLTFDNVKMIMPGRDSNTGLIYEDEVFDLEEACNLLKIGKDEIERLLREEDIPARMLGGQWRFSRKALMKWLGEGISRDYIKRTET